MHQLKPCVFLDRDGIVNKPPVGRYIERPEDFEILPEFLEALRLICERGYEAVIVTNQKGVSTGQVKPAALMEMHRVLIETVLRHNLRLLDIRISTTADDAHPDRKPNPGLLLTAAHEYGLDLHRSWMIGDNVRDIEAGRRAGCRTVFVGTDAPDTANHQVPNMSALVKFLRQHLDFV
ncbi:MAG: HAD-IIIA family hydrolase [Verrucomicrobia bacterium]|nr:MAG: HAD-IIIA family hydrolase [Verrucomicrobiota bacterium]